MRSDMKAGRAIMYLF